MITNEELATYRANAKETIEQLTPEFKANVTKEVLNNIINKSHKFAIDNHLDSEDDLVDSSFDYSFALENEGLWLLPDGEIDYGDTSSQGTPLVGVDPLEDLRHFEVALVETLIAIRDYLFTETPKETSRVLFTLTEDDVKTVAQDNGYSDKAVQSVIATLLHGNIDFDWYETIDDLLDTAENKLN